MNLLYKVKLKLNDIIKKYYAITITYQSYKN